MKISSRLPSVIAEKPRVVTEAARAKPVDQFSLAASSSPEIRQAGAAALRDGVSLLALRVANSEARVAPALDPRYFDVARSVAHIDGLVAKYPAIASKVNLSELPGASKTHEGRSIYALRLSGAKAEGKPVVVIAAQHHARELNSSIMAVRAMERIAAGYGVDPALTKLLDERDVYVVPMVNPDGVNTVWTDQRMWRKNRSPNADGSRGTDPNRNYPFLHGLCGSSNTGSSETYHGAAPGSEPETRTMMALQRALRPELYIDFHNSGNEVLDLYPPCAKVDSKVLELANTYRDRLRAPMGFGAREPSASGEAPHWYWSQGTLAYLIEVGTAFQPRFEETIEDEKRVWKGLESALTTWRPSARGRVTGEGGEAVEATFTVKQPIFAHGEHSASRADGLFHLWLPKGTWDVEVAAPGYATQTVQIVVDAYDKAQPLDVQLKRAASV